MAPLHFREARVSVISLLLRWLSAAAITLAPGLVVVLPSLILPGADYTNAEEQYRAFASGGFPYQGLVLQITGAVLLVPAVQGIAGIVFRRGRGVILGLAGLVIGMVAAFALLLLLGSELGMAFVLSHGNDTEARVSLALAMSRWTVYSALLAVGFAAFFIALPILALALWRSRLVPIVVPLLFLLPILIGFAPLPARAIELLASLGLLLPCGWITVRLLRRPPSWSPLNRAAGRSTAVSEENLSPSNATGS